MNPKHDEVIYQAYCDYQEMCGPDGEDRYPTYHSYVQDQVDNYRHLASIEEGNQEFLDLLEAEVIRFENLEPMRPQATDDAEEPGQYVNARLWVSTRVQDPVAKIRDLLIEDADMSWMEIYLEDPE